MAQFRNKSTIEIMDKGLLKDEVIEQEKKLHKAIMQSNIIALNELLHDDLLFITPHGEAITKEVDLKTYRGGLLKIDELHRISKT